MATQYDQITPTLQSFIKAQPLFFVATAPLSEHGHVNLSPKGYDTFCILSSKQVAYLDLTGSGNETSAHLAENGRITFLFCAFGGAPQILRLYGKGKTVLPGAGRGIELWPHFPSHPCLPIRMGNGRYSAQNANTQHECQVFACAALQCLQADTTPVSTSSVVELAAEGSLQT